MRLTPEPISRGYDSERVENTSTLVSRTALGRIRYGVAQHPCPPWFSTWRRVPAPRVARSTIRPVTGYGAFVRCACRLGWSPRKRPDGSGSGRSRRRQRGDAPVGATRRSQGWAVLDVNDRALLTR